MRDRGVELLRSRKIVTITLDMTNGLDVLGCCQPLGVATIGDAEAEATARLFKALADPARVKIVNLLAASDEPVCACEFEPSLGLTQATVSYHLTRLTEAGLLTREQRGKWAYFSINSETLAGLADLVQLKEAIA
jgi:ArsR family transcriptional regulator, arsenate/arsenite/antimonite-responsive transcriptional repressor